MARATKQEESDEAPGAPEWMVTFSDCMTLLLTFFVLLLSFSSFDDRVFRRLKVSYSRAFSRITPVLGSERDSLLLLPRIRHTDDLDQGSEKPTPEDGLTDGLMEETRLADLHGGMTFVVPSKRLFWGVGTVLSAEGRGTMETMASFLRRVPSRVIISENGPAGNLGSEYFGLPRAWAIMKYLTTEQKIDGRRFSISAASTLPRESPPNIGPDSGRPESERAVEILLLEWSI
ncbi:MAG: flagellar motor protein MotB [Planctomycetota bacterium]|jgi:chemotaxis protein MotB